MTFEQIVGFTIALIIMAVGLVGCILPAIPGTPLIFVGALAHRLYFGSSSVNNWIFLTLFLLMLLSVLLDYLASTVGAKKLGATWRGMLGAIVGAIVGIFFSLPGIILGPFLGAMLFELAGGYAFKQALYAGFGAFLGLVAGAIGKCAIAVVMVALFVVNIVFRSGTPAVL